MRVPLLVISIIVSVTIVGLLAMGPPGQRDPGGSSAPAGLPATPFATMSLPDAQGTPVRLADLVPGIYLVVRDCPCVDLLRATILTAPAGVWVVQITSTTAAASQATNALSAAPSPGLAAPGATGGEATTDRRARVLVDTDGLTVAAAPTLADTADPADPAAILVDRRGEIARILPSVRSTADFTTDLARIAP